MKRALFGTLWGLAAPGVALGQLNTYNIIVSNDVSPQNPHATVQVWAAFDPSHYAFHEVYFDLFAAADPGSFSDPIHKLWAPGQHDDGLVSPDGDSVTGIKTRQFYFPDVLYADTSNPILLWEVTWSTDDFSPRKVSLDTLTSEYLVYTDDIGNFEDFADSIIEGHGSLTVIPAPASAVSVLVLWGIARRRRST